MEDKVKQVLVIRKDLRTVGGQKVRTGKIIAQAAHAPIAVMLNNGTYSDKRVFELELDSDWFEWLSGSFTKICVYVNSEQELVDVYDKAVVAGLKCVLITDSGLTEFGGVPTKTCCAIGPAKSSALEPITGHLPLF